MWCRPRLEQGRVGKVVERLNESRVSVVYKGYSKSSGGVLYVACKANLVAMISKLEKRKSCHKSMSWRSDSNQAGWTMVFKVIGQRGSTSLDSR